MKLHNFEHRKQYFELDAYSRSDIVQFLKGPNHFKAYRENKDKMEPSESMDYGTALHEYVLNNSNFDKIYSIKPDGLKLSTKEGIAFKENAIAAGREIIPESWGFHIKQQFEAIMANKSARKIIEKAVYEPAVSWVDEESGISCKTMPDIYNQEMNLCADLKTAAFFKFTERGLGYSIRDYGYDIQGAMALDAIGVSRFALIFVSTDYKHPWRAVDVAVREIHPDDIQRARMAYKQALQELKICLATDSWPSKWSEEIVPITASIVETEYENEEDISL